MLSYTGSSGHIYQLNNKLGEGGEGIVYGLLNDDKYVAKIYKDSHFRTESERNITERKLKAMLSMKLTGYVNKLLMFTWPQDILYYKGFMVGFIMPRVNSSLKIFSIYRMGEDVKKVYPRFTWKNSVQLAYQLAWVTSFLHLNGVVVGDFNQNNIYVDSNNNTVILVDCDSFDIKDPITGEHFPCTVGFSEVLAPELQTVGNLKNGVFTKESDNFSLAIHIFRLLMRNADPFGGIIHSKASTSSTPMNQSILNGECQYVRNVGKTIPAWSPRLDAMPPEIQTLFDKTFNYSATNALQKRFLRASSEEWCVALLPYTKAWPNRNLKRCSHDRLHVYAAHNKKCPWCLCEGYDYDLGTERINLVAQYITKIMYILVVAAILVTLAQLQGFLSDDHSVWRSFCHNIFVVKKEFADILLNKYECFLINFSAFILKRLKIATTLQCFLNNNRMLINHLIEQVVNIFVIVLALIENLKKLLLMLKNNVVFCGGTVFRKIKGIIHFGGK